MSGDGFSKLRALADNPHHEPYSIEEVSFLGQKMWAVFVARPDSDLIVREPIAMTMDIDYAEQIADAMRRAQ